MQELHIIQTAAEDYADVYQNLRELKNFRTQFQVRLKMMRRQYRDLCLLYESDAANDYFMDEWKNISSSATDACADLEAQLVYLDEEISKVTRGVTVMDTLQDPLGREALQNYIVADTNISLSSLGRVREAYNDIISTLTTIQRNALSEE